ncbi:MAG TPA: DUF2934 domain-containing protein [Candidatus Binatia bacterium]|nr:DUF2934 domain-containing protein [Candidatus Binatia bacterium]
MKLENNKNQTKRRSSPRQKKARAKEVSAMAESILEPKTDPGKVGKAPDFPEEWISIAAYYIWKNDGQPDGQDADYWERAKAELTQLWKEGNLPTGWQSSDEER